MAWKERSRMDERVVLVSEYVKGERSMAELCREFGVSRKTAYKWLARYTAEGPSGLADRSRAPLSHPHRVDSIVMEAILAARRSHPHWGARKILACSDESSRRWRCPCQAQRVLSSPSTAFPGPGMRVAARHRIRTPSPRPTRRIAFGAPTSRATSEPATDGAAIP